MSEVGKKIRFIPEFALKPILLNINSMSIRARIILFTLVATLLPASSLGWLFYVNSQQVMEEKTTQELVTGVTQLQNQLDLWVKAKSYDLKVFSSSFVLTENLDSLLESKEKNSTYQQEIKNYFQLLLSQFPNYLRLMLFDSTGQLLVQSSKNGQVFDLPLLWSLGGFTNDLQLIDQIEDSPNFIVAMPVLSSERKVSGWLVVEMEMSLLTSLIRESNADTNSAVALIDKFGNQVVAVSAKREVIEQNLISKENAKNLLNNKNKLNRVSNSDGIKLVGVVADGKALPWSVLMLRSETEIFASINRLRNISIVIALALIVLIGFISLLLAHSILHPLQRLKVAAEQVSDGDLNVSLEDVAQDELGQAMKVFNSMVERLGHSYQELELLSTTDPLTGLFNRKRVMNILTDALERYRRYGSIFSILMIDIDFFKRVNDQYGHLAGDSVLRDVGNIFSIALRNIDTAARYGGEEFLIILDQSNETEARNTAERIRKSVDRHKFEYEGLDLHCTLSIGITTVRNSNQTENILIREADDALYKAKNEGRNRSYIFIEEPLPVIFTAIKEK